MMLTSAALALLLTRPAPPPQKPPEPIESTAQKPDAKTKKADKPKTVFKLGDEHPEFDLGKGSRIELRARFAADRSDSEASTADPAEVSNIDLGKRRIGVSGEIPATSYPRLKSRTCFDIHFLASSAFLSLTALMIRFCASVIRARA